MNFEIPSDKPLAAAAYGRNLYIRPTPALPTVHAFCHLPLTPRNSTLLYPNHCTHLQRVLSDAWSAEEVMLQFYTSDSGIAVIDNLLTDEALEELLAFAEQSTIWHDDGRTSMRVALDSAISSQRGYLGAYKHEGFACGLLFQVCSCGWGVVIASQGSTHTRPHEQVAEELRHRLPDVFKNHTLNQAWGYKYNSTKVCRGGLCVLVFLA